MLFWKGFLAGVFALAIGIVAIVQLERLLPPQVLGHTRYRVATAESLSAVDNLGKVFMKKTAAAMFERMQISAKKDGILLVPLSGFRDYNKQSDLFFHGARNKSESKALRSHVCAPPGFSEHHTGYSVDIGDGAYDDQNLELTFKQTAAFRWMKKNAGQYHFELSFPTDQKNPRIAYEPWHWRYVGDLASFKTFFYSRMFPAWFRAK